MHSSQKLKQQESKNQHARHYHPHILYIYDSQTLSYNLH